MRGEVCNEMVSAIGLFLHRWSWAIFGLGATAVNAEERSIEPRQSRAKIVEDALRREANGAVEDRLDLLRAAH